LRPGPPPPYFYPILPYPCLASPPSYSGKADQLYDLGKGEAKLENHGLGKGRQRRAKERHRSGRAVENTG